LEQEAMSEHHCEVNVAPMCTGPDDPRYRPCGKVARFRVESDTWMCADHYDEYQEAMKQVTKNYSGQPMDDL
jgi:hypothetical protein